jgi:hypothetical protein
MHPLKFGVLFLFSSALAVAQASIRQVDFKNFTYPISGSLLKHDRLVWLDVPQNGHATKKAIQLFNGVDSAGSPGFTLQSVLFADVTGNGEEEAIVVLRYDASETQKTHYVYIYSFADGQPTLLAYCHTGEGGRAGLEKIYGGRGELVLDLLDPKQMSDDCCSAGYVRVRYQWRKGRFEEVGTPESGTF